MELCSLMSATVGAAAPVESGSEPVSMPRLTSGAGQPIGRQKLAAQVAQRIESEIVASDWPVGRVLGSEPELMERYGVSRAVFREAVRLVEHHQVATMRRGRSGGLVVRAPDATAVTAAMV